MVQFGDYRFVQDTVGPEGDGDVLVPVASLEGFDAEAPTPVLDVVDLQGRQVSFELSGRVHLGSRLVGWSYWETEETDAGAPCVNLVVLADGVSASTF